MPLQTLFEPLLKGQRFYTGVPFFTKDECRENMINFKRLSESLKSLGVYCEFAVKDKTIQSETDGLTYIHTTVKIGKSDIGWPLFGQAVSLTLNVRKVFS